jgi:hypothetical protein
MTASSEQATSSNGNETAKRSRKRQTNQQTTGNEQQSNQTATSSRPAKLSSNEQQRPATNDLNQRQPMTATGKQATSKRRAKSS